MTLFGKIEKWLARVGASMAQTYGAFPAWKAALLHTEVRDAANTCFHDRASCITAGNRWCRVRESAPIATRTRKHNTNSDGL